jgi:hypothetical protein
MNQAKVEAKTNKNVPKCVRLKVVSKRKIFISFAGRRGQATYQWDRSPVGF